jgi:AcrR family transcriptional regulator
MAVAAFHNKRDQAREAIILDVARDCFLADGYAATSMSTIAARLGGSKGTLYNYFKNKEELFAAVIQRQCAEALAGLQATAIEGADTRTQLTRMTRNLLRYITQPASIAMNRLVIGESERFPELAQVFYESGPRRGQEVLAEHLRALMHAGELRRADADEAATQLKDLTIGNVMWLTLWRVRPEPTAADIDRYVAAGVDAFLRAYAP